MNEYWLDVLAVEKLKAYLLHHESDIATGINDYEELKDIFENLFERAPESLPVTWEPVGSRTKKIDS